MEYCGSPLGGELHILHTVCPEDIAQTHFGGFLRRRKRQHTVEDDSEQVCACVCSACVCAHVCFAVLVHFRV